MLTEGTVLQGRYVVQKVLGSGGMGAVYLARQDNLGGRLVAIKETVFHFNDPSQQAQVFEQFHREARILASIEHQNLVDVRDFFEENGSCFMVMTFVDGQTLHDVVSASAQFLPIPQVLAWMDQLCDVLEVLHAHDPPVILRDLKPGNVMLDRKGRIRLIDFGIARLDENTFKTATFLKGAGTVGFAPIEQFGGGHTDARADVYALGATLYMILTRTIPPWSMQLATGEAQLVPPARINPQIPSSLEAVILKMMSLRRDERYQTISQAREALKAAAADVRTGGEALPIHATPSFCAQCGTTLVPGGQACPRCGPLPVADSGPRSGSGGWPTSPPSPTPGSAWPQAAPQGGPPSAQQLPGPAPQGAPPSAQQLPGPAPQGAPGRPPTAPQQAPPSWPPAVPPQAPGWPTSAGQPPVPAWPPAAPPQTPAWPAPLPQQPWPVAPQPGPSPGGGKGLKIAVVVVLIAVVGMIAYPRLTSGTRGGASPGVGGASTTPAQGPSLAAIKEPSWDPAPARIRCSSNLKNIGTALEMWSTDNSGRYPNALSQLSPNYLKSVPTCPNSTRTYGFESASQPDAYTVNCPGSNHFDAGIAGYFPVYNSVEGLIPQEPYLQNQPSDLDSHASRGYALQSLENYRAAIAAYNEGLAQDPGNTYLTYRLAECWRALGEHEKAGGLAAKAWASGKNLDFINLVAETKVASNDLAGATAAVEEAAQLANRDVERAQVAEARVIVLAGRQQFADVKSATGQGLTGEFSPWGASYMALAAAASMDSPQMRRHAEDGLKGFGPRNGGAGELAALVAIGYLIEKEPEKAHDFLARVIPDMRDAVSASEALYVAGTIDENELLRRATTLEQQTRAHFTIALTLRAKGDASRATEHFAWAAEKGLIGSVQSSVSRALMRL